MNFTIGQTVFDVGINFLTKDVSVTEQKVLCVGETSIFVSGNDSVWGSFSESIFLFSLKDQFKPDKIFESFTHTVWTDDREKADKYAETVREILLLKNNLTNSKAS